MKESETHKLLRASMNALLSYQYGNQATELAESLAEKINDHMETICPYCCSPLVRSPKYQNEYCSSWHYMEGGCPPVPQPVNKEK